MLVWNGALSFTSFPGFGQAKWVGVKNYNSLLDNPDFWESLLHSTFYIIPMALIPTALAVFGAVAIFDAFRGRLARSFFPWVRGAFYLPQVIPIAIAGTIWGWMLSRDGLLNQILRGLGAVNPTTNWLATPISALVSVSLFMVWLQFGFSFVIFLAGLSRLDPATVEAASLDGANWWQRFCFIALPSLRPEVIVVLIITAIAGFKVFAPVVYLTMGGPRGSTASVSSFAIDSFFGGGSIGRGSAATTLLAIAIGVVAVVIAVLFVRVTRRDGGLSGDGS